MMNVFSIFLATFLSDNYILSRLLGIYPAINVQKKEISLLLEGILVTIAMILLSILSYSLHTWVLEPLDVSYLAIMGLPLLLFVITQFIVFFSKKMGKDNIDITVGHIIANSAVLAVVFFSIEQESSTLLSWAGNALGAGAGYTLVSILLSDIIGTIDEKLIVPIFKGLPLQLITLGLMAYAFWGFCCLMP